jgi:hypothetical protein
MASKAQATTFVGRQLWEYRIVHAKRRLSSAGLLDGLRAELNDLGQEGWELINIVESGGETFLFLKRPAE